MKIYKTNPRPQINDLDTLPIIDRSLIDYEKYHKFIGHAGIKCSMAIQATRGCPYRCFFCDIHKISRIHVRRSVEHLFKEVEILADIGVRRIEFIDDSFNVNEKDFAAFLRLVLKHRLHLEFFFPTGLRGDLLNEGIIDLMVEAGAIGVNLALEHPSPRIQKIMRKNLDVEKLRKNLQYITEKYPSVILVLNAMHGFPTETEDEALMTLDFIKSIRWIHFPYLHNVIIFSGTELEHFALESGITREAIGQSQDMSYHQFPSTLPFSRDFTRRIRTMFLRDYVLNKERLKHVLPHQLMRFSEDELNQKYRSYFPTGIKSLDDLLGLAKIELAGLRPKVSFKESQCSIPDLKKRIEERFPPQTKKSKKALKLLLIDLSAYLSHNIDSREYNVFEPPMGLMSLLTYINERFKDRVEGKICKSRIDFDSYQELCSLINGFSPDIIGVRAMTFYKGFFHEAVDHIRKCGIKVPIIAGGPYPTTSYNDLLQDSNINLVVIGEGEITLAAIIEQSLLNNNHLPDTETLKSIPGLAFREEK